MKKKKGFTLIELLAVIVVLAVIALIATPTILGVIDKAQKGSLQDSGYGLVQAADLYYAQYSNGKTVRFDIEDNKITTEASNKLNYKGSIKNGTVLINNKGEVTVCINDGKHAAYKNYKDTKVTVVDSKTCTVPENKYAVYLDNESTITELNNQELTQEIENLKNEILTLKDELNSTVTSDSILKQVYPVGSIYISVDNTDPSELFGGTWKVYASGKTLVGVDSDNMNYSSVNKTGGSSTVTLSVSNLPSHTHSIPTLTGTTSQTGSHNHGMESSYIAWPTHSSTGSEWHVTFHHETDVANGVYTKWFTASPGGAHQHTITTYSSITDPAGSGASFSIQNPYITVYMWKRIS